MLCLYMKKLNEAGVKPGSDLTPFLFFGGGGFRLPRVRRSDRLGYNC